MRSLTAKYLAVALAILMSACGEREYLVGTANCRFAVPIGVQEIRSAGATPTDSASSSIYLQLNADLLPALHAPDQQSFRVIVSCEQTPELDLSEQLRDSGISGPMRVQQQAGLDLYRVFKGDAEVSWVLLNFDPRIRDGGSPNNEIVAQCYLLSASATEPYSCVHTMRRRDVRIEYRFGPTSLGALEAVDDRIFGILTRRS